MKQVEIYALKHPTTNEIRYIGKANNSSNRLKTHLSDSKTRNTPVYFWIKKLISEKLLPAIEIIAITNCENWPKKEKELIALHSKNGRLLNVSPGGNQPFCPVKQRAINGRNVARMVHDNYERKRLWSLKQKMGIILTQINPFHAANIREKLLTHGIII